MNYLKKNVNIWQKCMLSLDATIHQAIEMIDKASIKIILVIDGDGKLLGTLSDGDIRRGLINGHTLTDSICLLVNRKPIVVLSTATHDLVLQLMMINKVHQIPVVDEENYVIGIRLWNEIALPVKRSNVIFIMAGGRGSRMNSYTESCPKPMLNVGGKPMIEHIINRAKSEGFSDFVISVNYLADMIEDYFGSGESLSVRIRYLRENTPLGTAGALSLLIEAPLAPMIVINGDVMANIRYADLLDFHCLHDSKATMAVSLYELQNPYGVVKVDGVNITGFEEKPIIRNYVNAGIYVLSPEIFRLLNKSEPCDMPTLFERANNAAFKTIVYPMHEAWIDIGTPPDLNRANKLDFIQGGGDVN